MIQKDDKSIIQFQPICQQNKPQRIQSKDYQQYLQTIKSNNAYRHPQQLQHLKTQFSFFSIQYDSKSIFHKQLTIKIQSCSNRSQIVKIVATWGKFTMPIIMLNRNRISINHRQLIGQGQRGRIYSSKGGSKTFAIKCIQFKKMGSIKAAKYSAIQQFFITKIASCLKIGPSISNFLGFDLIIYSNCIQFWIQKCMPLSDKNHPINYKNLYFSLFLLHHFQIIHYDIKFDNIMFSQTYNRHVFIDYGLSQLSQFEGGFKYRISFRGSLDYCCQDMFQAFQTKQQQFIDPYFNDIHCLKVSLKYNAQRSLFMYQQPYIQQLQFLQVNQDTIAKEYVIKLVILMKYHIYFQKYGQAKQLFASLDNKSQDLIKFHLLDFIREINLTSDLKQFYHKLYKQKYLTDNLTEFYDILNNNNNHVNFNLVLDQKQQILQQNMASHLKQEYGIQFQDIDQQSSYRQYIKKYLLSKSPPFNTQSYLKYFIICFSFSYNPYRFTIAQKLHISCSILKKIQKSAELLQFVQKQSQQRLSQQFSIKVIKQCILQILKQYCSKEVFLKCKTQLELTNELFNLIEHLFILNFSITIEIIDLFQTFLQNIWIESKKKIFFLIKIMTFTQWLVHRINQTSDIQESLNCVHKWLFDKFEDYKKSSFDSNERNLFQYFQIYLYYRHDIAILQLYSARITEVTIQGLSLSIQQFLDITLLHLYSYQRSQQTIKSLYENIFMGKKLQSFFWIFMMANFYFIYFDYKSCSKLYKICKFHMGSKLLEQFDLFYIHKINIRRPNKDVFHTYHKFIYNVSKNYLKYNIQFFVTFLRQLMNFLNINSSNQEYLYLKTIYSEFITNKINFQQFLLSKEIKVSCSISCIRLTVIQDLFDIISVHVYNLQAQKNIQQYMKQLMDLAQRFDCQICKKIIFAGYYIRKLSQIPLKSQQNCRNQMFQQIDKIISKITILQEQFPLNLNKKYFEIKKRSYLMSICLTDQQTQQHYHGILNFYFYLKQQNKLALYFQWGRGRSIILITMITLFKYASLEEFVYFLIQLTNIIQNSSVKFRFQLIKKVFHAFTLIQQNVNIIKILQQIDKGCQKSNKQSKYNIIYYSKIFECIITKLVPQQAFKSLLWRKIMKLHIQCEYYIKRKINVENLWLQQINQSKKVIKERKLKYIRKKALYNSIIEQQTVKYKIKGKFKNIYRPFNNILRQKIKKIYFDK